MKFLNTYDMEWAVLFECQQYRLTNAQAITDFTICHLSSITLAHNVICLFVPGIFRFRPFSLLRTCVIDASHLYCSNKKLIILLIFRLQGLCLLLAQSVALFLKTQQVISEFMCSEDGPLSH